MPALDRKIFLSHLLLIAAFSLVAMLPAYFRGVPGGNDQAQHFQFAWTIYDSVRSGELYPSLASETNRGLGDVGLRFYPPLTYYVIAGIYAMTHDWYFASLLAFTLAFFVGGIGVYLWARDESEPDHALIAALIYTFAPYHLNQLYNNGLFAEFMAMAVMPYCFLFLARVCRNGRLSDTVGLAIAYALLILTHLPLTILCSVAMALYAMLLLRKSTFATTSVKLITAVLSSAAMTAFYWSRWLPEIEWVKHSSPKYFSTTWDYRTNFLLLPDHFLRFGEDALNLWLADIFLVSMILIAIPSFVYLLRDKDLRVKSVIALFAMLALAVFMTTPLSGFLWENLSFLQKVQFPWRWLAVVTIFASILAPIGIVRASAAMKAGKNRLLPIGLGLIFLGYIFTAAFLTKGAMHSSRSQIDLMMQQIPSAEGCDCWWPIWAERPAFGQTEKVKASGRKLDVSSWSATSRQFHIGSGEPVTAVVKTFYYPRWQAEINGSPASAKADENGVLNIDVPAGEADVKLTFQEPGYVRTAGFVSITAWLIMLVFGGLLLLKSRKEPNATAPQFR